MRPLRGAPAGSCAASSHDVGTGDELSAARHLFAAIEAGIRATAPRSALRGLLATMRDQQRATEGEIIARGQRRRQALGEFARAARDVLAKQGRPAEQPPRCKRRESRASRAPR